MKSFFGLPPAVTLSARAGAAEKFAVAWSDEDGGYIATSAQFAGLSAFGESVDDALDNAIIALQLFEEVK